MAGEEGDGESLDRILDENAVFSQDTISPELLNVITVITQTAIREAMGARDPARAEGSNRRLTLLNSRASNPDIVYMRSDQQDFPDKMNAIREGNAQDLILLVRTQQLLTEYASNNHLDSYHWCIAFGPSAKDAIVSYIYTNSAVRETMTTEVKDILSTKGPTTEIINVMPSDDLYSVVAYMVRPNTLTNALQVLRSVKVVGTWQNTGMVVHLRARLQAFLAYLTLFEKVYRLVSHNRCRVNGQPLVDAQSFHKIQIMKKGAHVKEDTVESIMRTAVVDHQLLSGNLYDYIVSPLKQDKMLSLLTLCSHRSQQMAKSHEREFVAESAPAVSLMENTPEVNALCSEFVRPDAEGHRDIRSSLSFIIQFRVATLKEYSTLTTELFATATQEPDKRARARVVNPDRLTNREVFLQLVDVMPQSMQGEVPEAEVGAVLDRLRPPSQPESVDLAALDKVHIPTGQGQFMRKNTQQQPYKILKRGCYLKADMGTCTRDRCNFDHSEEVIKQTRQNSHFRDWQQRNGHKARQLSQAMLNSVADYHARAELAALDAPPSPPVATPAEEEDEEP